MSKFSIQIGKGVKTIDLKDPHLASFLGAFVSEGNLPHANKSLKISNKNLKFLEFATKNIRAVLGSYAATKLPPTPEHRDADEGFHKYFSTLVARVLTEGYGLRAGKRVVNNDGLPSLIFYAISNYSKNEWVRSWLVNYLQTRYSGDGHIKNINRSIILTKGNRLELANNLEKLVEKHYEKGKRSKQYPLELLHELRTVAKKPDNYPLELVHIQIALREIFGINARIECSGIRSIYHDRKVGTIIVTAHYKLVISRKDDAKKFYNEINFAPFDDKNRIKLKRVLSSYRAI